MASDTVNSNEEAAKVTKAVEEQRQRINELGLKVIKARLTKEAQEKRNESILNYFDRPGRDATRSDSGYMRSEVKTKYSILG